MRRFIVVGLGNFGSTVVETLHELGHTVTALDVDPAKVDRVAEIADHAIVGDGTRPEHLEAAGADHADGAVVSTGQDITSSLLAAVELRNFGLEEIFVKAASPLHARILEKLGFPESVFPEQESGRRLARRLAVTSVLEYATLGPGLAVQELAIPKRWIGKSLRELELPRRYKVSVIAVRDYMTDTTRPVIDPDAPLKESDTLFVTGEERHLAEIAEAE